MIAGRIKTNGADRRMLMEYFDFSKNDDRVFIPKAQHPKISCTFDKFSEIKIDSPGLENYRKWCEENDKSIKQQEL